MHKLGRSLLVGSVCVLVGACARTPPVAMLRPVVAKPAVERQLSAGEGRHLLNRFAFGPKPGEVEQVVKLGTVAWLDAQLGPRAPDPALEQALTPYRSAMEAPEALVVRWLGDDWQDGAMRDGEIRKEIKDRAKDQLARIALTELTRHIQSERQLEEVMVDFWTNHFNVFGRKGLVRIFAGDFIERTLRPHALGRFEELLVATARHPAMLLYLDNARSRAPRENASGEPRGGLNENYARELLELHTLGVDGGYKQGDVEALARILTGFSVRRPKEGGFGFMFRPGAHDGSEKELLGQHFAGGGGEEEGLRALSLLARHPATARHIATKLCARFVADEPPPACVEAATRSYRESNGEIARVLRTIALHDSFWQTSVQNKKLKTPLELVVSSARALGARPDGSLGLAKVLERMGEPVLLESVPTGHPEAESEWADTSGLLSRMSYASLLGAGRLPGVELDLDKVLSAKGDELVPRASALLLGAPVRERTLATLKNAVAGLDDPEARRAIVVALLVGSPEYQRQ